jgi:hypothetical protein
VRGFPLGGAGDRVPLGAVLAEDAGLEERLHQGQDPLVPDSIPDPSQESGVGDLVEARRDVTLQHPLVGVGCEEVDLGDRVLCPAFGAKAVAARLEVRLEDRLEHQLERGLHDPVGNGRDP